MFLKFSQLTQGMTLPKFVDGGTKVTGDLALAAGASDRIRAERVTAAAGTS